MTRYWAWICDAQRLRTFHLIMTVAWTLTIIPTLIWWKDSILWVALLSVWANIASHFAAWQAARVEVKQDIAEAVAAEATEIEQLRP